MVSYDHYHHQIMEFEIHDWPDILQQRTPSILVGDMKAANGWVEATMYTSPLPKVTDFGKQQWMWKEPVTTGKIIQFQTDQVIMDNIDAIDRLLLYKYQHVTKPTEEGDHLVLQPSPKGYAIPWKGTFTEERWALDLFAGGVSGWSCALSYLQNHGFPKHHVISIDHDLSQVAQSAVTHASRIFPAVKLPPDFLLKHPGPCHFHASIQDSCWRQPVAMTKPDPWLLSPPCQPWSTSGKQQGFGDQNGKSLIHALGLARIHRPRVLLLENVQGFRYHQDYQHYVSLCSWAGYRIIHDKIVDVSTMAPTQRSRVLQILERIEDEQPLTPWIDWGKTHNPKLREWPYSLQMQANEIKEWIPSPDTMLKYWDPTMMPSGNHPSITGYRIVDPQQKDASLHGILWKTA